MFDPEQIEGSVWVLGFEGEGDRYFECSRVFDYDDKHYAIMFSLYDSEIAELENEEPAEPCGCGCAHDDEEPSEECCSDEEEERDFTVVRLIVNAEGEPDIAPLTPEEENDEDLEAVIEEVLEDIEEEYEEEEEEEK